MNKLCEKLIAAIDNDDLPLAKKLINIDRKSGYPSGVLTYTFDL